MSVLVSELIDEAFIDLGVIQPGETISSSMLQNAFLMLKQMVSSLSTERAMNYVAQHQTFTLAAGTSIYTVGTAGSLASVAQAIMITAWNASFGNFSTGGQIISFDEFRAKTLNATARRSILPELVAADQAFPNINLEVFPPPDVNPGTLRLDYFSPIPVFASTATSLTLPDGWELMLHSNLAVKLAPQYARTSGITPELAALAQNSKEAIMQKNAAILGLTQGPQAAAQQ